MKTIRNHLRPEIRKPFDGAIHAVEIGLIIWYLGTGVFLVWSFGDKQFQLEPLWIYFISIAAILIWSTIFFAISAMVPLFVGGWYLTRSILNQKPFFFVKAPIHKGIFHGVVVSALWFGVVFIFILMFGPQIDPVMEKLTDRPFDWKGFLILPSIGFVVGILFATVYSILLVNAIDASAKK